MAARHTNHLDYEDIRNRIIRYRLDNGLTFRDLATSISELTPTKAVHMKTLWNIENGRSFSARIAAKVKAFLEVAGA